MKTPLSLLLSLLAVLLTGCETQQLTLKDHGEQLAPAFGVDASDLKLLSYCQFQFIEKLTKSNFPATPGIVALSDSHFYLMTDVINRSEPNYKIAIPIHEMEGISKLSSQFQLKHEGQVVVLRLNNASSSQLTMAKYETVYQLFADNEVPEVAAVTEYRLPAYSPGRTPNNAGRNNPSMNPTGGFGGPNTPNASGAPIASSR